MTKIPILQLVDIRRSCVSHTHTHTQIQFANETKRRSYCDCVYTGSKMKMCTSCFLRSPTMVVKLLTVTIVGVLLFLEGALFIVEACPYLNTIQRQNGGSSLTQKNGIPNPHLAVGEEGQTSSRTRVDELRELLQPLREIELEYYRNRRSHYSEPEPPVVNDIIASSQKDEL